MYYFVISAMIQFYKCKEIQNLGMAIAKIGYYK